MLKTPNNEYLHLVTILTFDDSYSSSTEYIRKGKMMLGHCKHVILPNYIFLKITPLNPCGTARLYFNR